MEVRTRLDDWEREKNEKKMREDEKEDWECRREKRRKRKGRMEK